MLCKHCGKEIPGTSKFCIYCGLSMSPEQTPQQTHPTLDRPYQPGSGSPNQAGSWNAYQPGSANPYQAGNGSPYQGGSANPYQAGSGNAYQPGSANPYQTGNESPYQAGSANPYQAGNGAPYQGGSGAFNPGNPPPAQNQSGTWGPHPSGGQAHSVPPLPPQGAIGAAAQAGGSILRKAGRAKVVALLSAAVVLALVVIVSLFGLLFGSGKPEDTIAELEKALNKLDMDAMMECFDEPTQKLMEGSLGLAGSLSGIDLNSLSDLAAGFGGLMADAGLTPTFRLEVTDVDYSGDDACLVTVAMTASYGGESESDTAQLPMKKEGGKWLISISALGDLDGLEDIF